jgi:hypothetical protein
LGCAAFLLHCFFPIYTPEGRYSTNFSKKILDVNQFLLDITATIVVVLMYKVSPESNEAFEAFDRSRTKGTFELRLLLASLLRDEIRQIQRRRTSRDKYEG